MVFRTFGSYLKKRILRYFENNTKSRFIVALFMLVAIGVLSGGVYYFVREGLSSVASTEDPFVARATPLYVYQLFFLIIGFLIFTSSIVSGLFNYFQNERERWIMASPSYNKLSWYKFGRALIDSSWPIVVLALPLLLAVRNVYGLELFELLIAFLATILFSFFASGGAITIIFILAILFSKFKIKNFKVLIMSAGFTCLAIGLGIWLQVVRMDLEKLFQVEEAVAPALDTMKANFVMFPSHFPAMTLHSLQIGEMTIGLKWFGGTIGLFLLIIGIFRMVKSNFLKVWQIFQEGSFEAKPATDVSKQKTKPFGFLSIPRSSRDALFKKELLNSFRSGKNLFWIGFLLILMMAQVGVIILIDRYIYIAGQTTLGVNPFTLSTQFGVIMFFINAFILRFAFPSFSQENDTGWVIGSAPINLRKIFFAKYKLYVILFTIISLVSLSFYISVLSIPIIPILITAFMTIIGVMSLTMAGLAMGVIFVNFHTDDPQKLSTSAPGIGFTIFALLYSIFGAYFLYQMLILESYFIFIITFFAVSTFIYQFTKNKALTSLKDLEFL